MSQAPTQKWPIVEYFQLYLYLSINEFLIQEMKNASFWFIRTFFCLKMTRPTSVKTNFPEYILLD